MKLEFVEVEGFRGFRERVRFDVPAGFLVIAGRNGVGKSTILDAIDFALTGSINKYEVERAKGGGLNDHIWWLGEGRAKQNFVRVSFVDEEGQSYAVTRSRDRSEADGLPEVLRRLHDARSAESQLSDGKGLMEATLIRDEIISASSLDLPGQQRFNTVKAAIGSIVGPDHTKRTGDILSEAKTVLNEEQDRLSLLQTELGRLLAQLTEARTEASQSTDVSEALRLVSAALQNTTTGRSAEDIRTILANRKTSLTKFNQARQIATATLNERSYVRSDDFKREYSAAEATLQQAVALHASNTERVAIARQLLETEEQADVQGSHFAALLEHGSILGLQAGHCPLCDAVRSDSEFAGSLNAIRTRLAGLAERIAQAKRTLDSASADLRSSQEAVDRATSTLESLRARLMAAQATDLTIRDDYDEAEFFEVSIDDLALAEKSAVAEEQRLVALERAALILGASTAMERVANLENQIAALRMQIDRTIGTISNAESAVEFARQIDTAAKGLSNEILVEQFETVMPLLKELYRRLRPHADWTEIDADFGGKVRGSLNFTVGNGRNPQFLFSSGQRRAAGLAFLLAVHLSRPWCHWQSLLLDDPVQHVDDYRALNLVEVLAAIRRSGRQLVVAVEDGALADLLCRRLRSTHAEPGRRYDLGHAADGSAKIDGVLDILPLPQQALKLAAVS